MPYPPVLGELSRASAAESRAVAQDSFYALHRPLLAYRPVAPRSIFVEEEPCHESAKANDVHTHQQLPFQLTSSTKAKSAAAHVLPITSEELVWYMSRAESNQLVDEFLHAGEKAVENAPMYATSIKRKRKLKMNKHKHRKLRKRTRALRKRLGKI
ncbi:hypothetical protein THASP1DRAFT_27892 [Thamnocephalis sphaerospora]|uniref:Small ribosomal subunit protein mS38 n=1 Tax=Thamnocephalis sphaerospora TaxID=78915 RepID=A0A4P9XXE9_9FUNG|nr:hypothetical protein THASP1DRAFT_27892 [Thamnocephalis sphaerospora]|eukprot:RKP10341.1 hypothetical protein THASP1DRAFT_27892 [Thamnocephalis sphaerospora]